MDFTKKDSNAEDKLMDKKGLIIAAIILSFLLGCVGSCEKKKDETPKPQVHAPFGVVDTFPADRWVLIKSDTILSRAHVLHELGLSAADINGRVRINPSMAQSSIVNYFIKNGRIKKMTSWN